MKKNFRSIATVAVSTLLVLGTLTGCGEKENDAANTSAGTSAGASSTEANDTATGNIAPNSADSSVTHVHDLKVEDYVDPGNYKNIVVDMNLSQYAVDEGYVRYLSYSTMTSVASSIEDVVYDTTSAAKKYDLVNISYVGYIDGEATDSTTSDNALLLLGSGQYIPGYEDGLIGVCPGETVDLNLTFPENYGTEVAGKDVLFTVTLNGIFPIERVFEQIQATYGREFTSYQDMLDYYNSYLESSSSSSYETDYQNAAVTALMNQVEYKADFPESMVTYYQGISSSALDSYASYYGLDVDSFCSQYLGITAEQYISEQGEMQMKRDAVFQAIANAEDLNLDDGHLRSRIEQMLGGYGYTTDQVTEMWDNLNLDDYRTMFMEEDVMEFLMKYVTVNDTSAN